MTRRRSGGTTGICEAKFEHGSTPTVAEASAVALRALADKMADRTTQEMDRISRSASPYRLNVKGQFLAFLAQSGKFEELCALVAVRRLRFGPLQYSWLAEL
jgi:hypothetical protein